MTLLPVRNRIIFVFLILLLFSPLLFSGTLLSQNNNAIGDFKCSNQDKESVCGSVGYRLKLHIPGWEGAWFITGRVHAWGETNATILIGKKESVKLALSNEASTTCLPSPPNIPLNEPYTLADTFFMPLLVLTPDTRLTAKQIQKLYPVDSTMVAVARKNQDGTYVISRIPYFGCESSTLVSSPSPVR